MQTIAVPNRVTACCDFSDAHRVLPTLAQLPEVFA
jgi:hypothetical protein